MKPKHPVLLAAIALLLILVGCDAITKVSDTISKPTEREKYQRTIADNDTLYRWKNAYQDAMADSLEVPLPYGERGTFHPGQFPVYSYIVNTGIGEKLEVSIEAPAAATFLEIFIWDDGQWQRVSEKPLHASKTAFGNGAPERYKVVMQPQLLANGAFFITLQNAPLYGFPVAGKGNAAIQSFWDAPRDGGARKHEGIDIFANRGTPVVAVADGTVTFAGERGIGGRQVWLRTGLFGNSIYYAHLDRTTAQDGDRVNAGDTLGFVGNTGNAKGGPPHLHFGIYGFGGAVNPLPFVSRTAKINAKHFPRDNRSLTAVVNSKGQS